MSITKPTVITEAWCAGDPASYVIPPVTTSNSVANQTTGYPVLQATPYSQGGLPIDRVQTNGIFNLYSSILAWEQAGGTFTFETTVSNAYNGYNLGAVLAYTRTNGSVGFVYSTKNNNTDNFISNPAFIGSSWKDIANGAVSAMLPDITDNLNSHLVSITGSAGLSVTNGNTKSYGSLLDCVNNSGAIRVVNSAYNAELAGLRPTGLTFLNGNSYPNTGRPWFEGNYGVNLSDYSSNEGQTGWVRFPNGMLMQWQQLTVSGVFSNWYFPQTFISHVSALQCACVGGNSLMGIGFVNNSTCQLYQHGAYGTSVVHVLAIGR